MKPTLLKKASTLTLSFLLILSVGLLFSFSSSKKSNDNTELLSIVIDYYPDFQLIRITEGTSSFKKIAILDTDNKRKLLLRWLNETDFKIVRREFSDNFDNQYIFEILQEYLSKGWELNSHNFGEGRDENEDSQMSFYLFTK